MTWARSAAIVAISLTASVAAAQLGPGPGQPFGGSEAGCVPAARALLSCADRLTRAFKTLVAAATTCHSRQADARYEEVYFAGPPAGDDEECENAAGAGFDKILNSLAASGKCSGSAVLSLAATEAGVLLADQSQPLSLDARSGALYCDPTSAAPIDPGGDDGGFVPSTAANLSCSDRVGKNLATLTGRVLRCHQLAAHRDFAQTSPTFDETACEATALARFDTASAPLSGSGNCPACLSAAAQHSLASSVVSELDAANNAVYPCPDNVLHPGTVNLDRPTLMALGVQLLISGDENHNGTVTLRYRPTGDPSWRDALPLMRVRPESVVGRFVEEQFAGSIFDLRPGVSYDLELHAVDPDGPVDQTLTLSGTTRTVPQGPAMPNPIAVSDTVGLTAALAAAQAGDVITLSDGTYAGPFVLDASGTAVNPIVVRGTTAAGTILDGGGCTACNVFEVYGSFVHIENLTLRSANRALRFQTAGAEANVARRLITRDTTLGFGSRENQLDFYLCDNDLQGRLVWPQIYTDDGGAHANDDGIHVEGFGHVVCHNRVLGFGDALKTEQVGARALDFYGNEVLSAYDNGIELDESEGNARALRNRFTNTYATISFQPIYGGPAYAIRNVVVNVAHEQMKFHGLGGATGPSGVLAYQNTFVSPDMALFLDTDAASHHFAIENNLFVGPSMLSGTKAVDWLGPIDDGLFDYDGYFPDGVYRFNVPPGGLVSYASFAAMQAGGLFESHGVFLTQPVFASSLSAPSSYTVTLPAQDVTLDGSSNAVDAGVVLPNVTDGYTGAAPDLGAFERGCPLPIYGPRPAGIDESNEPLGCAP
jgi:hypothetical protein